MRIAPGAATNRTPPAGSAHGASWPDQGPPQWDGAFIGAAVGRGTALSLLTGARQHVVVLTVGPQLGRADGYASLQDAVAGAHALGGPERVAVVLRPADATRCYLHEVVASLVDADPRRGENGRIVSGALTSPLPGIARYELRMPEAVALVADGHVLAHR